MNSHAPIQNRKRFSFHASYKILLIMKLTVLLLISTFLQTSAAVYAQKISISEKQASLEKIFDRIKEQTGYSFIYAGEDMKKANPVTLKVRDADLDKALKICFAHQPLSFTIKDKIIIVKPKAAEPSVPVVHAHPNINVQGQVSDSANGKPIAGATIQIKGGTVGTATDEDGKFSLSVPDDAVLVVSYLGYNKKEIPVNGKTTLNISLAPVLTGLNQVVVVGYGTQKKVDVTGAVSSVGPKDLTAITTPDLSNSLAGKLPGLRVMEVGGEPGSYDNNIDIRGWGNMLVVVDGIPRDDFQKIDPSSIASVTILKDASAAVYGLKAANGVMLITTKQGEAGQAKITLNSTYGWQKMTEFPMPIRNSIDNLILKNEAALVAGNPLPYPDWQKYTGDDPDYPNVDWWGLTVRNAMPISKNNISLEGGSDKVTYYMTIGNLYQTGLYKSNSLNYERYNFRSNVTAKIAKGLTGNVILSGMIDEKNQPFGGSSFDFFKQVWMQPTYEPVYANNTAPYYYDGEADRNPLAVINSDLTGYQKYQEKSYQSTLSLTWDLPFVKGLQVKGLFAYDMTHHHNKIWRKAYNEYKYDSATNTYPATGLTSPTQLQQVFDETVYTESQLSLHYQGTFAKKHNVEALLLAEGRSGTGTNFTAQRNFSLSALDQLNAGLSDNQVANGSDKVLASNEALVGRFNYDFNSKYLAEFSFRYDGSSLFPKDTRWGFFPGFSVGWRMSEESFIKDNVSFIDNLKLRFSYGKLGDNSDANGFEYLQGYTYPSGSYIFDGKTLTAGSAVTGLPNPNITWYTATTTNIGVDANLWKGLFDFTLELFQRKREGLLATRAIALPAEFGSDLPQENLESDLSKGFEVVLGHANHIGDFSYNINANFTFTRTKWLHREAAPPGNSYLYWRNSSEDRWEGIQWGYGVVGQFQDQQQIDLAPVQNANGHSELFPGDIQYEDWNGDGMISDLDVHPIARSVDPEMFYGLNFAGGWKGITLNLFFQGASRYSMQAGEQLQGPLPWGRNSLQIFLDRWHHEDPLDFSTPWVPGKYPISRDGFGYAPNKLASTYWFQNITYLRLKSVELGYSLPAKWISKIKAQEVRIYTNAFNVLTWKDKDINFDPEHRLSGDGSDNGYTYPLMANYNVGLSITF